MDSQNFPGSWGSDFVARKFGIILINQLLVYTLMGM